MIAYLYICSTSFQYNGSDTINEVCEKLVNFSQLYDYIWENFRSDNKFCVNTDKLSQALVYTKLTLSDILFSNDSPLKRPYRFLLQTTFQKSIPTKIDSNKDLYDYLSLESADECQGIVVINRQKDIPLCNQVFSSIQGWREFRRYFLSKYPHSPEFFIQEALKYFPNLQFSINICSRLGEVLSKHSHNIVAGLSILNDYCYNDWEKYSGESVAFIEYFAKTYGIEGSFEGTKKTALKAHFKKLSGGDDFECYCEPHLKYYQDDCGNEGQHMRIYFQHPNASPDKCIYIGYIMKHID